MSAARDHQLRFVRFIILAATKTQGYPKRTDNWAKGLAQFGAALADFFSCGPLSRHRHEFDRLSEFEARTP